MPFDPSRGVKEVTIGFDPSKPLKLVDERRFDPSRGVTPLETGLKEVVPDFGLMDFIQQRDVQVSESSPVTSGELPAQPSGTLSSPFPKTEEEVIQQQVPADTKDAELGAPAKIEPFGKPGTVMRGAGQTAAGLMEWALNKPEEAIGSLTMAGPAIALRYAPEIVKGFWDDVKKAKEGDREAFGRALTLGALVAGPAALKKGANALADKAIVEGKPGAKVVSPEVIAEEAGMANTRGEGLRSGVVGEKAIVEPPIPDVPVQHETVLPGAADTFKETTGQPVKKVASDAIEVGSADTPQPITVYHGSPSKVVGELRTNKADDFPLSGVSVTTDKTVADRYAADLDLRKGGAEFPSVESFEFSGKTIDVSELRKLWEATGRKWEDSLTKDITQFAIDKGYDAVDLASAGMGEPGELFVLNPKALRSNEPPVVGYETASGVVTEKPPTVKGEAIPPKVDETTPRVEPPAGEPKPPVEEPATPKAPAVEGEPTVTGIKNARVDQQRKERGLEPLMEPLRKSDPVLWDRAMKMVEEEPGIGDRLTKDLTERPRPMTDEEGVIMTRHMVDMRNELNRARDAGDQAGTLAEQAKERARKATTVEEREAAIAQEMDARAKAEHYASESERISDALTLVEQATGRQQVPGGPGAGTLMGQAFRARQFLMREDYSRAGLEQRKRAANGFKPLSQQQLADISVAAKKIEVLEGRLKATEDARAKIEAERDLAKLKAELAQEEAKAAKAETAQKVKTAREEERAQVKGASLAAKIAKTLDTRAEAARARLRGKIMSLSPADIADIAEIAASNLYHLGMDVGKWTTKMVEEFGEKIKPHLDAILERAKEIVADAQSGKLPKVEKAKVAKDPQETIRARLRTRIAEYERRIAEGDFSPWRKAPTPMTKETLKIHFKLEQVKRRFMESLIEDKMRQRTGGQKVYHGMVEGLNAMRAVLTSADLSAVLRQGLFVGMAHPVRAAKAIGPMLKAFANEKNAFAVEQNILRRDNYPLYRASKLYLAEQGASLSRMEEAYLSRTATKIPLVGRMVKASERAYITYLNKLRADSFDAMKASLGKGGEITIEQARIISNFINVATGRGTLTMADQAAAGLNAVFFAPRYVASRFQLLGLQPIYYGLLTGKAPLVGKGALAARKMVAMEYAKALTGMAVVYGLGIAAGADVELDPRSSDFGKMKFGNTRIDLMGGLSQVTVLVSRIKTGETKSLRTGGITPLVPKPGQKMPYGAPTLNDVLLRFARSKLAPAPGLVWDYASGSDVVGNPTTPWSMVAKTTLPISLRDIYDTMEEQGVPTGTAIGVLTVFGANVQNFDATRRR